MEIQDYDETLLQRRYNLDLVKPGNSNSVFVYRAIKAGSFDGKKTYMVSDIDIRRRKNLGYLALCYAILGFEERSEQIRRMLLYRRKNSMSSYGKLSLSVRNSSEF